MNSRSFPDNDTQKLGQSDDLIVREREQIEDREGTLLVNLWKLYQKNTFWYVRSNMHYEQILLQKENLQLI